MDGTGFSRVIHNTVSAQVTGALGGLQVNLVACIGLLMLHDTGLGEREALGSTTVRLLLRHGVVLLPKIRRTQGERQMKTRIISGLIMAPLLIVLYLGGWFLWAAALIIAVMGIHEFCNGWESLDVHPSKPVCYVMTALLFATTFITGGLSGKAASVSAMPQYINNMMLISIWLYCVLDFMFFF